MDLLHEINRHGTTNIMVTQDHELARQTRPNIHILDGRINEENGTDPTVNPAMASA
jgi:ABC-type ATPase involved in cell division